MTKIRFACLYVAPVLCLLLAATAPLDAARHDDKDVIYARGRIIEGYVLREHMDFTYYKTYRVVKSEQKIRTSDVRRIRYYGMTQEGPYKKGMEDKAGGQYAVAATRFQRLVATGDQEWQKTYGLFHAGDCWELAGEYAKAAQSFGQLASSYPENRMFFDALYRQGVCLARAKDYPGAEAVAKQLWDYSNANNREKRSKARATAIEAAVAGEQGDMDKAYELARKVVISSNDKETYFHWGLYWASLLRSQKRYDDAARSYKILLSNVGSDSAMIAKVSLGMGVCLAKAGEKERALYELLKMDALPYGSPEERAEAQYYAGVMMWETAQETKEDSDASDKRKDFALEKEIMAQELLEGVSNNIASPEFSGMAKNYLLVNLGIDVDAESETVEGEAADADGEAGAATTGTAADDAAVGIMP